MHRLSYYIITSNLKLYINGIYVASNSKGYYSRCRVFSEVVISGYIRYLTYGTTKYTHSIYESGTSICYKTDKKLLFNKYYIYAETSTSGINIRIEYEISPDYGEQSRGVKTIAKIEV
jgi:hypothetical protein